MRARDLWFPIATVGIAAALLVAISAADHAHEAQAAVIQRNAAGPVVTETDGELPDAIWITRETTVAPDQGIPVVEQLPVEEEDEPINEKDLYILAHLLAGECQSGSVELQEAVGSVVLNRVAHPSYPDSIEGVVFQHRQYACTWDGNYDREPTPRNWEVAEYLLRHGSSIPSNVVFQAQFRQGPCWKKIGSEYFCIIDR